MRREDALPIIRSIYERVAPHVTGHLSRSTPTWNHLYSDHALDRRQASSLRFAVHPDGYASFRVQLSSTDRGADSTVQVKEICAATPQARVSLWRYLLGLDLMARVQLGRGWPDDPVLDMLENTRAVLSGSGDHLWLRIVDLPRAIDTRGYAADVDVIVRITDDFCPWNAGTHRLRLRPDGGSLRTGTEQRTRSPARHRGSGRGIPGWHRDHPAGDGRSGVGQRARARPAGRSLADRIGAGTIRRFSDHAT